MSIEAVNWARRVGALGVLRPAEILLLWQLADSANQRAWMCWPSQQTLARETNQSLRTISTQIRRLKSLGLIQVEDRRGAGGGRICLEYYLVESALDRLQQDLSTRDDDPADMQDSQGDDSSSDGPVDDLQANIASRTRERHANGAFESPKRKLASNPNANSGDFAQVPLKEHARINHHHQSSDAREPSRANHQMIDDDKNALNYLGVEVQKLFQEFPELGHYVDSRSVAGVIDTVLGRAITRVANPTAYVRRALETDFYGLVLPFQADFTPIQQPAPDIGQHFREESFEAKPAPETSSSKLPRREDLPADAHPCSNPDHWDSLTRRQFVNCPKCRIERRLGQESRHVSSLMDEDIKRLPSWQQNWANEALRESRIADHHDVS